MVPACHSFPRLPRPWLRGHSLLPCLRVLADLSRTLSAVRAARIHNSTDDISLRRGCATRACRCGCALPCISVGPYRVCRWLFICRSTPVRLWLLTSLRLWFFWFIREGQIPPLPGGRAKAPGGTYGVASASTKRHRTDAFFMAALRYSQHTHRLSVPTTWVAQLKDSNLRLYYLPAQPCALHNSNYYALLSCSGLRHGRTPSFCRLRLARYAHTRDLQP